MKKWTPVLLLFFATSCTDQEEILLGDWKVNSKFYQSSYRIFKEGDNLKGLIISYDDGTSRYKYDGSAKRYLFENLKEKDDVFVDAITGATVKKGEQPAISIDIKSKDTLSVTTYIMRRPLIETWTRK